ncbi:MAG: flagellar basal body-associated FliL family protein [Spirochaetes bacterium]|nr:flagellar basal body-associated FliL family protein [Spirochaetota bacterium]MCK5267982.1 flagellar basal body-associated FliL family protein [Spirochaetota bacterium]
MGDNENFDDLGLEDEGIEGQDGQSSEGGGIKSFFSGALIRILLYVAAVILVIIIAVIVSKMTAESVSKSQGYKQDKEMFKEQAPPMSTFKMEPFLINTADRDENHLVRVKLRLAYKKNNLKLQTELLARRSQVRDLILLFFGGKKKEHMDTSEKKIRLKKSLKNTINRVLQSGMILDIYYEEFSVS